MLGPAALVTILALSLASADPAPAKKGAVVSRDDKPAFVIAEGKSTAKILLDDQTVPGLSEAAMTDLHMGPGTVVPEHVHEGSAELLYVIEGEGTMTMAGQKMHVKAGTAVYIPAGTKHGFTLPEGAKPLRAIQVYVPGGPQHRFRPKTDDRAGTR
jgi:mannose-6-phosphate isomerase-like protein (cupin superfamily)